MRWFGNVQCPTININIASFGAMQWDWIVAQTPRSLSDFREHLLDNNSQGVIHPDSHRRRNWENATSARMVIHEGRQHDNLIALIAYGLELAVAASKK